MKKLSVLIIAIVLITACSPVDIRPKDTRYEFDSLPNGQSTIENVINKAGGLVEWRNIGIVSFKITDEWFTKTYLTGSPWREKKLEAIIDWAPINQANTRLINENTKVNYGVQSGRTYTIDGDAVKQTNKELQDFYISTVRYLIEMPFRAYDAEVKKFVGEVQINGKQYYQVFYSWGGTKPDKEVDQFILYINNVTAEVEYATFTVRGSSKKSYTSVRFSQFNTYDRFRIPNKIDFYFNQKLPGEKISRTITIKHGSVGVSRKKGYLTPLPEEATSEKE